MQQLLLRRVFDSSFEMVSWIQIASYHASKNYYQEDPNEAAWTALYLQKIQYIYRCASPGF